MRADCGMAGFSLIEMMIVVALVGILASVAVFFYGRNLKRAQADAEAAAMFAEFRKRQEQFATENGVYRSTGSSDVDYHPATPAGSRVPQPIAPLPAAWVELKMSPPMQDLYCAYVTIAGAAGDNSNIGATAQSFGMTAAPVTNWYYMIAECDFDSDPATNALYFRRSDNDVLQVRNRGR